MDEAKIHELEMRIQEQNKTLIELKEGQTKILNALLGSLDNSAVGIIAEQRNLRKETDTLNKTVLAQAQAIEDLVTFKSDAKKIVAGIAVVIPFVFELLKLGLTALWEIIQKR